MASGAARLRGRLPSRGESFAILLTVVILNGVALRIFSSFGDGVGHAFVSLFGVNAAIWCALYAILRLGLAGEDGAPRPADKYVAAGLIAAALCPVMIVAAGGLFGASLYLIGTGAPATPLRRIGLIGLAATGPLLWGPVFLAMFGPEITRLEALLIAAGTGLPTDGNVFRSADGSATFVVAGGCSALANISMTLLLLVVAAELLAVPLTRKLVPVALGAIAVTILVNTARLAALGLYPDHFDYLHAGGGRDLFAWATLILSGAVIGFGLYRAAPPRG
ncbi:MAG TPA: hypothetical protein VK614_05575 [Allosphingosinicella sp.]|nr:hypothetical protein [Allosphingosinicella sp.]